MLQHIHIKNFTIIDDLELDLKNGMTVLTGETGAGKSIVIDAIELALGQRVNGELVRTGAERADISLDFNISNIPVAKRWLIEHELAAEECLIRRTLYSDGRSRSFINDVPMTLAPLRELAELLINIHGQHEFQTLMKVEKQITLLDHFAEQEQNVAALNTTYHLWHSKQQAYDALKAETLQAKKKAEYLSFQLKELNDLNLTQTELVKLEQEQKKLAHGETIITHCQQALAYLADSETAIVSQLTTTLQQLTAIQAVCPQLHNTIELLNNSLINSEEASNELQHYLNTLDLDPERLQQVELRLGKAYELARKHRINIEALPNFHEQLTREYHQLEHHDEHLLALQRALDELRTEYLQQAQQLTQARQKAATKLSKLITASMQNLGMPGGKFMVELTTKDPSTLHLNGLEKITFMVTANPGQSLQPLNKVASGGELSRISLAIQVIATQQSNTPTLVFDEVDVGIGGATAETVGLLLRKLAQNAQVLCITHLAQVAAKGHHHLQVKKITKQDLTYSSLQLLTPQARIEEIARMTGGLKITEQTLAHAKEMLSLDTF